MVVAIGIDEIIQFHPEGEFEVGGLDAEDKRRLLALGSTRSIQQNVYNSRTMQFPSKDEGIIAIETNNNNNVCKDEGDEYSWKQQCGKIRCCTCCVIFLFHTKEFVVE